MKTAYYGVVGNRDYIKVDGERHPFWGFLDVQPDGWLSSLVYARKDVPGDRPAIWDCGAWSYKDKAEPPHTAESIVPLYQEFAPPGASVIAPDHMLIPGTDLEARRKFNAESARRFIDCCPPTFTPMATVHGMDDDEREANLRTVLGIGYRHVALGGMAARAAKKNELLACVRRLREAAPGCRLHVLGLSSPDYYRHWCRLGVDSCDGSSHFKKAFTGGEFYLPREGWGLDKYLAARPGSPVTAPPCDCRACSLLRGRGIDTRFYGSNEHNMGRAAHNLNMLMAAQKRASGPRIALVACCSAKLSAPAPARDLYVSDLFRKARAWAERHSDGWRILSAKHGLVHPDTVIAPYDETLNNKSVEQRKAWGLKVIEQLGPLTVAASFVLLGGNAYAEPLAVLHAERPLRGMGIGRQLAWLKSQLESQAELFASDAAGG